MTRLRTMTLAAALLVALVLGVFAYLLVDTQSQDREDQRTRFDDVAGISASVTNGIFVAARDGAQQQAAAQFGGAQISQAELDSTAAQGQLAYVAVLDDRGRQLAAAGDMTPELGPAVKTALESGQSRLSDYTEVDGKGVIEWAIPYETASGRRIYVTGSPAKAFEDFLKRSLGDLPDFADPETAMVDSKGVVLGGVRLSVPVGEMLPDQELLEALDERTRGDYGGDRYFASGPIEGSPFRIVLDTTEEELYEDVRTTVPWLIFGAFALMALTGLFLLRRSLASAAELQRRELNERHAVEINDNIIQGLALAKYQLQRGEGEASATQLADTLREAQRLVSGLLGDAEVKAGQLRREAAAETTGPEPDGEEPRI